MPVNKVQTKARAAAVATQVAQTEPFKGFDYDALIAILIELVPIIVSCFRPSDGPSTQRHVAAQWDEDQASNQYGGYDRNLALRTQRSALEAARKRGIILTRAQAMILAIRTLDDVRLGDTEQTSVVVMEQLEWSF